MKHETKPVKVTTEDKKTIIEILKKANGERI